jgi:hypothetical protein
MVTYGSVVYGSVKTEKPSDIKGMRLTPGGGGGGFSILHLERIFRFVKILILGFIKILILGFIKILFPRARY